MANAPKPFKIYDHGSFLSTLKSLDFTGDVSLSEVAGRVQISISGGGVSDHGALTGLGDDDHTQYLNSSRADTWLGTKSTTNLAEGTNLYYTDVRADARITLQKGAANGIAPLDGSSKIASSYLPAIAITDTFVVASQVAMLALSSAEKGDVAVRTDLNKSFILMGTNPAVLGDWQELLTPTDSVLSVNGQTGAVSLNTSHISENTNLYFTNARAVSALNGCNVSMFTNDAGYITGIGSFGLGALSDVKDTLSPTDGQVLTYVTANSRWEAATIPTPSIALDSLLDVNAPTPSPGQFLGWGGTTWDAITPSLLCLADVSVSAPTTGQVLKYNGSIWVNDTDLSGGGGLTVGSCYEIPFVDVAGTDFVYCGGFRYKDNLLETWQDGVVDPAYKCHIARNGCFDTYFRSDGMDAACIFQVGFFDSDNPVWGIRSCPQNTMYTVNQWLYFSDYCSQWGNDGANITLSDIDNSITMGFGCNFNIAGGGGSWAVGFCSMNPNNVMINCAYYLPSAAPVDGNCVMRLDTMSGLLTWQSMGGGAGSPAGSQYEIQHTDGAGNFTASCNFIYDYSSYFMQMRHNGTAELLRFSNSNCADYGWLIDVTNDTCGQGCNLTFRVGADGMSTPSRVRMDDYCCSENWIDFNPRLHMMRFHYNDGMTYNFNSEFGYDTSSNATVMRNCCFGKFEIGNCNVDKMVWTFATYNDYIKAQDCVVSYGGCCNFQWKFNNGCNNGWNEWLSSGPAQGLVISSDDSCCMCPLVLAQGLVKRVEFDTSGFMQICADLNIGSTTVCVGGTTTYSGTFDPNALTSMTFVNGLLTAVA